MSDKRELAPLRKIVGTDERGHDILDCGHHQPIPFGLWNPVRIAARKRARCKECFLLATSEAHHG